MAFGERQEVFTKKESHEFNVEARALPPGGLTNLTLNSSHS